MTEQKLTTWSFLRMSARQRLALARFLAFEVGVAVLPVLYASFGRYVTGIESEGAPGDAARHGDLHLLASIAALVGITALFFSERQDREPAALHHMTVPKVLAIAAALFVGIVGAYAYGTLVSKTVSGGSVVWHAWLYWSFGVITGAICIVVGEG